MAELIKVARTDQLSVGSRKLCTIKDRRIAVFNLAGTLYAIDNHCTHRDGPVGAMIVDGIKRSTQIEDRNPPVFNAAEFARSGRELIGAGDFDQLGHQTASADRSDSDVPPSWQSTNGSITNSNWACDSRSAASTACGDSARAKMKPRY